MRKTSILCILLLSLFLNLTQLGQLGFANLYYAAGVKSMMMNWHNFFFVSFDPTGFITIDKPPLGFWLQTISAEIFGFQGWSLILPQALAGVASVYLMYVLTKNQHGIGAGLSAALVLALTPIFVAASRNNTIDVLLVMTLLCAAVAFLPIKQELNLKKLLFAFFLIGIGFNIKSLESFLVLPTFYITYFFVEPKNYKKKFLHLLLATLVLLITSLPWFIAVDLISPENRPYVGSSQSNSEVELATGYNGLGHFLGHGIQRPGQTPGPRATSSNSATSNGQNPNRVQQGGMLGETGPAGLFRLFNLQIGGQISWLLPFALIGICSTLYQAHKGELSAEHRTAVLFWSCWLIPEMIFFSVAQGFHRYYLVMMAPAIAALTGISYRNLSHWFTTKQKEQSFLLITLIITIGSQAWIIAQYTDWRNWMLALVIGSSLLAIVLLTVVSRTNQESFKPYQKLAVGSCMLCVLIAPFSWSLTPVLYGARNGSSPSAGPDLNPQSIQATTPDSRANFGGRNTEINTSKLESFLLSHKGSEHYLLASSNARMTAPIILDTGEPVMTYGGFAGAEKIVTTSELAELIAAGQLRYILIETQATSNSNVTQQPEIDSWVIAHGIPVPDVKWQTTDEVIDTTNANLNPRGRMTMKLYDCSRYRS